MTRSIVHPSASSRETVDPLLRSPRSHRASDNAGEKINAGKLADTATPKSRSGLEGRPPHDPHRDETAGPLLEEAAQERDSRDAW